MARPRSFDETSVVESAARAFARGGYEATSLEVLVATSGLQRGSLYAAFGSKRGLFLAALRHGGAGGLEAELATDLLLVALLELAPEDHAVRATARSQVDGLPQPAALRLGTRLLERAGLSPPGQPASTPAPMRGPS